MAGRHHTESVGIDWVEVDRSIVVLATGSAGAFFVVLMAGWLFSGNDALLRQAVAPLSVGTTGAIMLVLGRPRAMVQLLVGALGLIAFVSFNDSGLPGNPLIGLLVMCIVGFVLTHRRVVVVGAFATATLAATGYAWHPDGTPDHDRAVMAFSIAVSFVVTAWLLHYLKTHSNRARQRLEELLANKSEFVSTVSHEIRTPLTTVVALAHEFDDRLADFTPEELRELSALLVREAADLADIVDDLLVAARPEHEELALEPQVVDVAALVERVTSDHHDIPMRIDVAPQPFAIADPLRLRQIVRNLITNAIRYGGLRVRIAVMADGDEVAIEVRDDGPPIRQADRERMFEAYRGAAEIQGRPGSVGLGLTVSRRLARLMGGDVEYRHDGREAIFRITLPQVSAPQRQHALG